MSEGRRTLKVNTGRHCTMCDEAPPSAPQMRGGRIPIYAEGEPHRRLMICLVHDRPI
jgi:hypothetical protein